MKKKAIMALVLICLLVLTLVSGQLAMTVNASGSGMTGVSEEAGSSEETGGTVINGENQKASGLEEVEPEEVSAENGQETFSQIHTQVFEELGIQVSILSEENIIPEDAVVRIVPVEGIEPEFIEEAVQWMAEEELEEKIREAEGSPLSIFHMYADLEVSGSSSYAFQVEVSYKDEQGNDCVLRPEGNDSLQIVIEALNPEEVSWDELQSIEVFTLTDETAVFSSGPVGYSSPVYTISIVKYAATADAAMVAAEQRVWDIINAYADMEYFLSDPYRDEMSEKQYEELRQAALAVTAECGTQYDKIKAIVGFVADRTYYDYYCLKFDDYADVTYINPYDIYIERRTICAGYARLVRTLCISIGIPCMDLIGKDHEYNAIYDSGQGKWIFADATWCSWNQYTDEQEWKYYGSSYNRFDLNVEEIAALSNHEVYWVDGLLDGGGNSVYYTLTAPEENWKRMDWYLAVSGVKQARAKAVGSLAGFDVTTVKGWSFNGNAFLTELDLSDTCVTNIEYCAFYQCTSLESVLCPDSLTEIGEWAFSGCEALPEIDISNTQVTSIGYCTFLKCASARAAKLPATLSQIGDWAFGACTSLLEIDLAGTRVTSIGEHAFYNCASANVIKLPSTLSNIGANAFAYAPEIPVTTVITPLSAAAVHYPGENNEWQYRNNVIVYTYYGTYDGYGFYAAENGGTVCLDDAGVQVIDEFKGDGTYTYFFQADGTAMRDRLSYHPDGEHVIYFDEKGHEVFSNFINVKKTIAGESVDDYCYFDVNGYLYVDVVTYDKDGKYLYYANPYGVLVRGKWFQFSDTVMYPDPNTGPRPWEGAAGGYGYADDNGILLTDTWVHDWEDRYCYLQGNGVALYP